MRQHKRKIVPEINLTPLLDVLFSILFIVMMTGMQNEKGMEQTYQLQAQQMQDRIDGLEKQIAEEEAGRKERERQFSGMELFRMEAVILTVYNVKESDGHYLVIRQGMEEKDIDRILLGADRMENVRTRLIELTENFLDQESQRPVYIVFYCDKEGIYTTEYRSVEETFQEMQKKHKEVFFKVIDERRIS